MPAAAGDRACPSSSTVARRPRRVELGARRPRASRRARGAAAPCRRSGGRPGSARSRPSRCRRRGRARRSTWMTSSSTKARTTSQIASVSRIAARNWLPSPSPSLAPRTMPAMSRNVTGRGDRLRRVVEGGEHREARVGHLDDADVGLDRGERVVRREHVVLRERVEQRRLADVRQSDDPDREPHGHLRPARLGRLGPDPGPRRHR